MTISFLLPRTQKSLKHKAKLEEKGFTVAVYAGAKADFSFTVTIESVWQLIKMWLIIKK